MQPIYHLLERANRALIRQTDTRRAAILGMIFGVLMVVIVFLVCVVLGFLTDLTNA